MESTDFSVKRSRPQFAFLLLLMDLANSSNNIVEGKKKLVSTGICEPMFSSQDAALARHFEISILENHCGRYSVLNDFPILKTDHSNAILQSSIDKSETCGTTLFWMPHCPKELYATLLESNWFSTHLSKLIIIGNSFADIVTAPTSESEQLRLGRIFAASKIAHITPLPEYIEDPYIFNNTSIHVFKHDPEQHGESSDFWTISGEEKKSLEDSMPKSPIIPIVK
jgi:hypothetical protein